MRRLGNRLGNVRTTNYGDVYDVKDVGLSRATNLADTNLAIAAHTDNPYRHPVPGVQMLHCLEMDTAAGVAKDNNSNHDSESDEEGGDSAGATTFTDGFAVAEQLRAEDPFSFALLSAVRHPFEYYNDGGSGGRGTLLKASVPVIEVDAATGAWCA